MTWGRAELRRAAFRGATWTVLTATGVGLWAALAGSPLDPFFLPFFLLLGLSTALLSWLEARGLVRHGQANREVVLLFVLAPLLVAIAILQGAYLLAFAQERSVHGALRLWEREMVRPALRPEFALAIALLAAPFVIAGWRRIALASPSRTFGWLALVALVSCGTIGFVLLGWIAVEVVYSVSDALERQVSLRLRTGRSDEVRALESLGLPFGKLWLLAWAGHDAARELLGHRAPVPPPELGAWLAGIEGAGRQAIRVAALSTARRVVPGWSPAPGWEQARDALRAWLETPAPEQADLAGERLLAVPLPAPDAFHRALIELGRAIGKSEFGRGAALARALPGLGEASEVRDEVAAALIDWALG